MPVTIRTTSVEDYLDESGEAHVKALILGEPSAGKTRSASYWPRPIFADCEKGRMSIADRRMPYADITSSQDLDSLLDQIEAKCRMFAPADRPYQTFVLDTADRLQRIYMDEILRANRRDSFEQRDWGTLDTKMSKTINRLLRLPMNLVVNVHMKGSQDGDSGPLIYGPQLKGSWRDQIAQEFDLVGHMATFWEMEDGERVLKRAIKWHPEPAFPILKDRSGQLPRYTGVEFSERDYEGLREAMFMSEAFENLPEAEVIEVIGTPVAPDVVPPVTGGPVPVAEPKAAAKKVAAPRATPQARRNVPPSPRVEQPAQEQVQEQVQEQAKDAAAGALARARGEAPAEPETPAAEPTPEPVQEPTQEQAEAAVAETLGGVTLSVTEADPEPPLAAAIKSPDLVGITCGTPAKTAKIPPYPGCTKDLGAFDGDLVNIALIKSKTYLCTDCFATFRKDGDHMATRERAVAMSN